MKRTIQSLIMCALLTFAHSATAQFYGIGGHLSRISGGAIKNFGIHASGDYMFDEKTGVVGSLGYFLPYTSDYELTLYARDNFTTPRSITINSKDRLTGFQVSALAKRFFVSEYEEEGFGLYGLGGIGFSSFSIKSTLDDYNEGVYGNFERSYYESSNGSGFTLTFGLGAQVQTGGGMFFFEPMVNIPANTAGDGTALEVEIPTTLQLNLGFRYLLY